MNALPPQEGTSNEILGQGLELLQKRLFEHGGKLLETNENSDILAAHMKSHNLDASKVVMTAAQVRDALWAAVCECFTSLKFERRPQLLYDKLVKAKEDRLLARDKARELREASENKTASFDLAAQGEKFAAQKTAEQQKAIDERATAEIARLIGDFTVSAGPNRINHQASEEGRAYLKSIKLTVNGTYSPTATLACVEACRWADSLEGMQRVHAKFISDYNNRAANERESRQQRERSGWVGARGR